MSLRVWGNETHFKERGKAVLDRLERKATVKAAEKAEKRKVRLRDKSCRWPRCTPKTRLECAHVVSKGMGGDKGTRSTSDGSGLVSIYHSAERADCGTPFGGRP